MIITECSGTTITTHNSHRHALEQIRALIEAPQKTIIVYFHEKRLSVFDESDGHEFAFTNDRSPAFKRVWLALSQLCSTCSAEALDDRTFAIDSSNVMVDLTEKALPESDYPDSLEGIDEGFASLWTDASWDDLPATPQRRIASPAVLVRPMIAIVPPPTASQPNAA